jgi:hypothetical protein
MSAIPARQASFAVNIGIHATVGALNQAEQADLRTWLQSGDDKVGRFWHIVGQIR